MIDVPVPLPAQPVRLMDRLRAFMRARHMAYRTEKSYCGWIREFIRFHHKRHPETMGAVEVEAWLSHLANNRSVAINTQLAGPGPPSVLLGEPSARKRSWSLQR